MFILQTKFGVTERNIIFASIYPHNEKMTEKCIDRKIMEYFVRLATS